MSLNFKAISFDEYVSTNAETAIITESFNKGKVTKVCDLIFQYLNRGKSPVKFVQVGGKSASEVYHQGGKEYRSIKYITNDVKEIVRFLFEEQGNDYIVKYVDIAFGSAFYSHRYDMKDLSLTKALPAIKDHVLSRNPDFFHTGITVTKLKKQPKYNAPVSDKEVDTLAKPTDLAPFAESFKLDLNRQQDFLCESVSDHHLEAMQPIKGTINRAMFLIANNYSRDEILETLNCSIPSYYAAKSALEKQGAIESVDIKSTPIHEPVTANPKEESESPRKAKMEAFIENYLKSNTGTVDEQFEKYYDQLEFFTSKLGPNGIVVTGGAGIGKTYSTARKLIDLVGDAEAVIEVSQEKLTAGNLYKYMFQARNKFLILDDCTGYDDDVITSLLQGALNKANALKNPNQNVVDFVKGYVNDSGEQVTKSTPRVLAWGTSWSKIKLTTNSEAQDATRYEEEDLLPNKFVYRGKILFLMNQTLADIASTNERLKSVYESRCASFEFNTNVEDALDFMSNPKILAHVDLNGSDVHLSMERRNEVIDYLKHLHGGGLGTDGYEFSVPFQRIDFRILQDALAYRATFSDDRWKKMIEAFLIPRAIPMLRQAMDASVKAKQGIKPKKR